jgi:hypothetical protein
VLTEAEGLPLIVKISPANTRDENMALPLLVNMPAIQGPRGAPRTRPKVLQGDAGYGTQALTAVVRWQGIKPLLAYVWMR